MDRPIVEARGGNISEQEYYMRIAWQQPEERACETCRGAGYLRYDRPVGSELFGRYTACQECVSRAATDEPIAEGPAPWAK